MSVTMKRADGVTVFTVTSDSNSVLPPLFQILKSLCFSPVCCSVSRHLRTLMGTSQSLLGALQIVVGLLNMGLGVLPMCHGYAAWWPTDANFFSVWMGAVFVFFGILCILSEKYPSPCLVIINVILNISGVGFAMVAMVMCALNIATIHHSLWDACEPDGDFWDFDSLTTLPPRKEGFIKRCLETKRLIIRLLRGINGVLLVLCLVELGLVLCSSTLSIKALRSSSKNSQKSLDDLEAYEGLEEEVISAKPSS
nr:transmembrane protein 176B-like [Nerophis lumbriciformis]XP_061790123.1 transmembrane protein 176B-like [Nerophis lumbriciformis]